MAVMSDLPKIVYDRLCAAKPQGAHPDADVLTAFAEQLLSDAERDTVLTHLAACRDCREIVAISLPGLEIAAQPEAEPASVSPAGSVPPPRGWFAWPNLRWAALAAGVVVVASVLMLRPGKPHDETIASVTHVQVPPPAAVETQPEAKTVPTAPQPSSELRDQATRAAKISLR